MVTAIVPATPAFDANGTPFSPEYGDIYHSAQSGPGQARHVFLDGNDLPARWAGARVFTIVEAGFGLGVNFLETWAAWRRDPARPARLHFVSIEKHPLGREHLAQFHARYPEHAALAAELQAAWPPPLPGLHRLHFEREGVTLTLAFADIAEAAPALRLAADAFFLDGFAPARNPGMWSPASLKALARLARPGATLATYTTARAVRDALSTAGFRTEQRPGFGGKRHMLAARYEPRAAVRPVEGPQWSERRAIVVGAGLAGAAVTERLAARGWHVHLIERRAAPAMESSAIPAGVFHPHVSRDDSLLSRLTRAGFLYGVGQWRALEAVGERLPWRQCGVLQLARDAREEARMAATVRALGFPAQYVDYLPRVAAGRQAGRPVRSGGWWFAGSGWMQPAGLITAQLASARGRLTLHAGREAHALDRGEDGLWHARDAAGALIAMAPVAVLANSHDAARLAAGGTPLKCVRGQLTLVPEDHLAGLKTVLAGAGHVIPGVLGSAVLGSTYDFGDPHPEPSVDGHAANLARLEQLLPGDRLQGAPETLAGAVGFRCVAGDRLPLIGALPPAVPLAKPARQVREIARAPGLYGAYAYASRGLTWAALGGELIASLVEGEPLPIESDLADAVDPARFVLRRSRRGG